MRRAGRGVCFKSGRKGGTFEGGGTGWGNLSLDASSIRDAYNRGAPVGSQGGVWDPTSDREQM